MSPSEIPHSDDTEQPASRVERSDIGDIEDNNVSNQSEPYEDELELLAPSYRSLQGEGDAEELEVEFDKVASQLDQQNGSGDAEAIPVDSEGDDANLTRSRRPGIDPALSPNRIGAELKRIEQEVRGILESRDPRRKRKLGGTRRWLELEDDLLRWRFTDRFEADALDRLHCLIRRRHNLFTRLRFLAGTRPVWNT